MTVAANTLEASTSPSSDNSMAARLFGLMLASLVPALIWSKVLSFGAWSFGVTVNSQVLMSFAVAVALFLLAICAPIMLRADQKA